MSSHHERFADHELLRRLDRGGSVEFYEARPLQAADETRLLIRFPAGEQRWPPWAWPSVAKHIIHPNVLRMFELLTVEERVTAILEFVPGLDLRELLGELLERQPLPSGLACFVVREVCQGLAAGLSALAPGGPLRATLGDLSPRSVRLARTGQVQVGFFGLGRLKPEGEALDRLDERLLFLAPEQASGQAAESPEVDVFRAGAILQRLLAGTPLGITARSPVDYVGAVARHPGRSFLLGNLPISRPLAAVLGRMLAREPAERFREPSEAALALSAVPELTEVRQTARGDLARLVARIAARA